MLVQQKWIDVELYQQKPAPFESHAARRRNTPRMLLLSPARVCSNVFLRIHSRRLHKTNSHYITCARFHSLAPRSPLKLSLPLARNLHIRPAERSLDPNWRPNLGVCKSSPINSVDTMPPSAETPKVGFFGAGQMCEALARGFIR